jgi:protein-S-isoprenylcysteine O-methyltransferase Ste14
MQRESVPPPTASVAAWAVAVVCCLIACAGQAAFSLLVVGLGLGWWPGTAMAGVGPWIHNTGWLMLFAAQHSGMARQCSKRLWTRVVPVYLERSVYAAMSGVVLAGLAWEWQPLDGETWWELPPAVEAGALLGALGMAGMCWRFDGIGLLGVRQVWEQGRKFAPDQLHIVGPYRWVRHPLMSCILLFLWCHPVMTPTLALLSGGMTVCMLLGLVLEERDLLKRFGPAYRAYRNRVPLLLPWCSPAAQAAYDEVPS